MAEHHMIFKTPEDNQELEDAMDGARLRAASQEFDNYLRAKIKYGEYHGEKLDLLEEIRSEFNSLMDGMII